MENRIERLVWQIERNNNPLIKFEDTYKTHELLEERGYWDHEPVTMSGHSWIFGRWEKKGSRKVVSKPFRFRVDHGNGYITQNLYFVGQVVPQTEDIALPKPNNPRTAAL